MIAVEAENRKIIQTIRKSYSTRADFIPKTMKINNKLTIGVSGIYTDAKRISKYLREESVDHHMVSK